MNKKKPKYHHTIDIPHEKETQKFPDDLLKKDIKEWAEERHLKLKPYPDTKMLVFSTYKDAESWAERVWRGIK